MPTHYIPLGNLPDKEIISGLDATLALATQRLSVRYGSQFQVTSAFVATQHEVSKNNKSVHLKYAEREIHIRRGLLEGARIRLIWRRSRSDAAQVSIGAGANVQKWLIRFGMLAALSISGIIVFGSPMRAGARVTWFIVFGIVLIPLTILYQVLMVLLRIKNNSFVNEVSIEMSSALERKN